MQFLDGTLLGQGEESRVDLDEYIFDDSGSGLDFHMVTGVLRMVSGKIAETNPEAFNISTPLATVGIRGTEIIAKIDVNGQIVGVTDMSPGHYVIVATADGEVRIEAPGLFSGVDKDGFLIQTQGLPQDFVDAVQAAAPLTSMGEAPRDPNDPPPEVPDPTGEGGQGGPPGEPGGEGDGEGDGTPGEDEGGGDSPPPPPPPAPDPAPPVVPEPEEEPVVPDPPDEPENEPEPDKDDDPVDDPPPSSGSSGENWTDALGSATLHYGTADGDTLYGLDYDDTLHGEDGDDVIDGGDDQDHLFGGMGNDSLDGGDQDDWLYGNEGDDSLFGNLGADSMFGNAGADSMKGGDGTDHMEGGDGNDTMNGEQGNDSILGQSGDDVLYGGGEGYDFLSGGLGADTMTGGSQGDTFFYTDTLDGGDTILDFKSAEDIIGLNSSASGFSAFTFNSGTLHADNFYYYLGSDYPGDGVGGGANEAIVYASASGSTTGKLYFDPDVTTTGGEVLLATISEVDGSGNPLDNNLDENNIQEDFTPGVN